MEYKNLTAKEKIPVLGLGTWKMGGGLIADRNNDDKYIEAISYAVKRGITHIDTAEIYGRGHAEELIAEALKTQDRKKLFITSKVSPFHLSYKGVIKACKGSLKRLKTDYLDLYLIHWPNPLASMKSTMAGFDELVSGGLIKHIGVSNFSASQLQNTQKHTKNKIVTNQVHYNLEHRNPEKEMVPYCQREKIILTAYSPLAQGGLVEGQKLETIAKKYKKTPLQVALRWLIEKPQVIVIPKASSTEHIDELFGALGWKMSEEDQDYLSAA